MKKTALLIMILTVLAKILGFLRDVTLSYFYGASNISDAYLISNTIPIVIFSFIGTGILTGFIPIYTNVESKYGDIEGNRFTNNLINIIVLLCTLIYGLTFIFAEEIVKIFASGFFGDTLRIATEFTRISLLSIYFTGLVYIFNGFLQVKNNYIIPALVSLPMNLIMMLSLYISSETNIIFIAIGNVLAIGSQLILLLPFAYRKGYKYSPVLNFNDDNIKQMGNNALPIILGASAVQINTLIDRTIASRIISGGISALNYANRLNLFIQGIFVLSIVTVIFPRITKLMIENKDKEFKNTISGGVTSINLFVTPVMVGAIVFSSQIISMLFGRGAFDENAVSLTSNALLYYSVGMLGFGHRELVSRVFYSMQNTKTPMINAAIGMILNIILNLILSRYLGIGGLALATSIAAIFTTVLLFISLRKKIGPFGMKQISISFLKILFASLVMGGLAKLSFNYLTASLSQNISLLVAIGVGAVSYFVIIYFMKIEDVDVIVGAIKKKLGRGAA